MKHLYFHTLTILIVTLFLVFTSKPVYAGNGTDVTIDPSGVYTPSAKDTEQKKDFGTYVVKMDTTYKDKINGIEAIYCLITVKRDTFTAVTYDITDIGSMTFKRLNVKNYKSDYASRKEALNNYIDGHIKPTNYKEPAAGNTFGTPWYIYEVEKAQADYLFLIYMSKLNFTETDYRSFPSDLDRKLCANDVTEGRLIYTYNDDISKIHSNDISKIKPFDSWSGTPTISVIDSYSATSGATIGKTNSEYGLQFTTSPLNASAVQRVSSTLTINKKVKVEMKFNFRFTAKYSVNTTIKGNCHKYGTVMNVTYQNLVGRKVTGLTAKICRNVDNHTNVQTFYSEVDVCEKDFVETVKCLDCGKIFSSVKKTKLGHDWREDQNVKPTCITDGYISYSCSRCSKGKRVTIPMLGHVNDNKFTVKRQPACTSPGWEETHCTRCGKVMDSRSIPALGHLDDNKFVTYIAPSCTDVGYAASHCVRCRREVTTKQVPKTEHQYDEGKVVEQPSIGKKGRIRYKCKVCKFIKYEDIPALSDPNQKTTEQKNTEQNSSVADDDKSYIDIAKIKKSDIKNNLKISDSKSGGKYRITSVKKKNGKVTGGAVTYVRPNNKKCTKMTAPKNIRIAGIKFKVTSISPLAFKGCKNLKSVTIESNVLTIGKSAFYGCSKLRTVNIRTKKLRKIGKNAFKGISSKATVKVPKGKVNSMKKKLKKAGLSKNAIVKAN